MENFTSGNFELGAVQKCKNRVDLEKNEDGFYLQKSASIQPREIAPSVGWQELVDDLAPNSWEAKRVLHVAVSMLRW